MAGGVFDVITAEHPAAIRDCVGDGELDGEPGPTKAEPMQSVKRGPVLHGHGQSKLGHDFGQHGFENGVACITGQARYGERDDAVEERRG